MISMTLNLEKFERARAREKERKKERDCEGEREREKNIFYSKVSIYNYIMYSAQRH